MNTPKHASDDDIARLWEGSPLVPKPLTASTEQKLIDRGLLGEKFFEPVKAIDEHPLAKKLYRDWKAGSKIMTKTQAYDLGSELDAQLAQIKALKAEVAELKRAGAALVKQVLTGVTPESL